MGSEFTAHFLLSLKSCYESTEVGCEYVTLARTIHKLNLFRLIVVTL